MTVTEPSRQLPVSAAADVVVAGGGMAGVAAALAAARSGVSVLLLENTCMLGGLATAGNVTVYLPIDDGRGRVVMGGIARELLDLSVADIRHPAPVAGFRPPPAVWLDPAATPDARADGPRFETGFNPWACALAMEELLLREGVRILYDTRVCAAFRDGDRVSHLAIENKSGRTAVACGAVVDATGDADVCFLAGEPTVSIDANVAGGWFYTLQDGGKLWLHASSHAFDKDAGKGNGAEGPFFRGDDGEQVTQQVLATRELHRKCLAKLRADHPDEDFQPFNLPTIPCFRMTRRLVGAHELAEGDMHRWFDDAVCLAPDWRRRGPVWAVPWRCLAATRTANLAACGRCASWDLSAWDAMRVIPVCAGEKKERPILPRPPVWASAITVVPWGAPAAANAFARLLVESSSRCSSISRPMLPPASHLRISASDRRSGASRFSGVVSLPVISAASVSRCHVQALPVNQFGKHPALFDQLVVRSFLGNHALVHHQDPVAVAYRAQPVGNHDPRAFQFVQRV